MDKCYKAIRRRERRVGGNRVMQNNRAYFSRRADEERSAAEKATNEKAREAHRKMAERYDEQSNSQPAD